MRKLRKKIKKIFDPFMILLKNKSIKSVNLININYIIILHLLFLH